MVCSVHELPSADTLTKLVNSVTTTMIKVKFSQTDPAAAKAGFRRAVLVIPGSQPVSVELSCDEESGHKLVHKFFGVDSIHDKRDLLDDALSELANITAGQVKRAMSIDQALGLPQVFDGGTTAPPSGNRVTLRADIDDIHLDVQITTKPPATP